MADEFAKGLGILTGAGLAWMVLAGWYTTPGFEDTQLIAPNPTNLDVYGTAAIILKEALFWFAILGALTFWVVIPAVRRGREAMADR
jgi:Zn-dependent protease with chaperone function